MPMWPYGPKAVHTLLRAPLSRDDLVNASEGYGDASPLARQRAQDSSLRRMEHQRDIEALQLGQLSDEQFRLRAYERELDERRARGENLYFDNLSAEAEGETAEPDGPEPTTPEAAAAKGDMRAYVKLTEARDARIRGERGNTR